MKSSLALILLVSLAAIVSSEFSQEGQEGGTRQKRMICYSRARDALVRYRRSTDNGNEEETAKGHFEPATFGYQGGSHGFNEIISGLTEDNSGNRVVREAVDSEEATGNKGKCYSGYTCEGTAMLLCQIGGKYYII